ncbi:MAG: RNA polymerase sigma factor [Acidobacteria bacterium]|nr:RNA polymerase sigma factor [Acidobacteriota bacterium]
MILDDEAIMTEVRAGDVGRLETLFDRHQPALVRYFVGLTGNRPLGEDLAQESFFRVLKYRHTYQPGANFRAWLYQIGRNVFADHIARRKTEVAMPEEVPEIRGNEMPPDREFQKKQEAVLLRRALAALPGDKREVLVLSRFLDMKYEEIAAVLKIEVGTVKVRVYRAMRELSDRFFALSGERAS